MQRNLAVLEELKDEDKDLVSTLTEHRQMRELSIFLEESKARLEDQLKKTRAELDEAKSSNNSFRNQVETAESHFKERISGLQSENTRLNSVISELTREIT